MDETFEVVTKGVRDPNVIEVEISRSKYPESAKHIEDAIVKEQPEVLTIDRAGSKANNPSDNRGAGSTFGHKLRPYPNGTKIKYKITDD